MISKFTRKDFLEALFSEYYKEHRGFILVKSVKRGDPRQSTRYFPNLDILAKEHYGEERDVYFAVCPRERMKAEREHIRYVVALWADLDIGEEGHEGKKRFFPGPQEAARAIRSFPRPPSIIVESGRGAHLYWLLRQVTEVTDPENIEKVLNNINEYLGCDTDTSLDTVARLPETVNTKVAGKPVNCDVKFINANFRYSLQDFENLGTAKVVAIPQPKAASRPSSVEPEPVSPEEYGGEEVPIPRAEGFDVDETVLDRWVDEISMGTSVVETATTVGAERMDAEAEGIPEDYEPEYEPEPGLDSVVAEMPVQQRRPALSVVRSSTSGVLGRLSQAQTEVEIVFMGSGELLTGVIAWNEDGLIGVEQGEYTYTIPLSSISFIRYRTE